MGIYIDVPFDVIEESAQYRQYTPLVRVELMLEDVMSRLPGRLRFFSVCFQRRRTARYMVQGKINVFVNLDCMVMHEKRETLVIRMEAGQQRICVINNLWKILIEEEFCFTVWLILGSKRWTNWRYVQNIRGVSCDGQGPDLCFVHWK